MDERYGPCMAVQPTDATNDIDTVVEAAMSNLDAEYAALCASMLVSA